LKDDEISEEERNPFDLIKEYKIDLLEEEKRHALIQKKGYGYRTTTLNATKARTATTIYPDWSKKINKKGLQEDSEDLTDENPAVHNVTK